MKRYKKRKRERFLSPEETERLGEVLRDAEREMPSGVAALRLLLLAGCRLSEIQFLRWEELLHQRIYLVGDTLRGLVQLSMDQWAEERAVQLGNNPAELKAIRDKLWLQRLECPLFDIERYAHHLESGYELMWENYVSGEPPRHIEIPRLSAGA